MNGHELYNRALEKKTLNFGHYTSFPKYIVTKKHHIALGTPYILKTDVNNCIWLFGTEIDKGWR